MKIAVSRASGTQNYSKYEAWLKAADPTVEVVDLYSLASVDDALRMLDTCSGLVLSGGPDVAPERYNEPEKRELCTSMDERRDELELALITRAEERRMPVLGICRGAQILNVAYGGTLVADIPTERGAQVEHRQIEGVDAHHTVHVESGSLIKRISRVLDGEINSAHHQSVDRLARAFAPAATADDGTVEAFEWGDASSGGKHFLLGVQWHPERMNYDSPFSLPIAHHFVQEAAAYNLLLASR